MMEPFDHRALTSPVCAANRVGFPREGLGVRETSRSQSAKTMSLRDCVRTKRHDKERVFL